MLHSVKGLLHEYAFGNHLDAFNVKVSKASVIIVRVETIWYNPGDARVSFDNGAESAMQLSSQWTSQVGHYHKVYLWL